MSKFCDRNYWDELYKNQPQNFEWFSLGYRHVRSVLSAYLPQPDAKLLHIGVGSSSLQREMEEVDGFWNVVNIDYSPEVIHRQINIQLRHFSRQTYVVADITNLGPSFPCDTYDTCLDKGTIDGMLSSSEPEDAVRMLSAVARVLKPGGMLLLITFGNPMMRYDLLCEAGLPWHVHYHVLKKKMVSSNLANSSAAASEPDSPPPAKLTFDISESRQMDGDACMDPGEFPMNGCTHYLYVCQKHAGSTT